jgi:hypothetical protein
VTVLTPGVGTSNAATFTITPGAGPAASHGAPARAAARAFPNPWRAGRHAGTALSIEGLAPGSRIRIFAPSGARVKTLEAAAGIAAWDLTNDAGQAVATGLYFFVATDSSGRQSVGHLAVFR